MGRLGMELGIASRLLQSHRLGRMGKSVSSAEPVVSPASRVLSRPSGIRRKLGLSSAKLSAADTARSPSEQTVGTRQSSRQQSSYASATKADTEARNKARHDTETKT